MGSRFRKTGGIFLLLTLAASPGWAEVHTWVDENGRRHFSDRQPGNGTESASEKIEVRNQPVKSVTPDMPRPRTKRPGRDASRRPPPEPRRWAEERTSLEDMTCEERKKAYYDSVACFGVCGRRMPGGAVDTSTCGHCRQMAEPDC